MQSPPILINLQFTILRSIFIIFILMAFFLVFFLVSEHAFYSIGLREAHNFFMDMEPFSRTEWHLGAEIGTSGAYLPGGFQKIIWSLFLFIFPMNHLTALLTGHIILTAMGILAISYVVYEKRGLVAASAYAVLIASSAHIMESVFIVWNMSLIPFSACIAILAIHKVTSKEDSRWFILAGFSVSMLISTHLIGTSFLIVFFALAFFKRNTLYSLSMFIIGLLPITGHYLIMDALGGFPNTQTFLNFLFFHIDALVIPFAAIAFLVSLSFIFRNRLMLLYSSSSRIFILIIPISIMVTVFVDGHRNPFAIDKEINNLKRIASSEQCNKKDRCLKAESIEDLSYKIAKHKKEEGLDSSLYDYINIERALSPMAYMKKRGGGMHAWDRELFIVPSHEPNEIGRMIFLSYVKPGDHGYQFIFTYRPIDRLEWRILLEREINILMSDASYYLRHLIKDDMAYYLSFLNAILFASMVAFIVFKRGRFSLMESSHGVLVIVSLIISSYAFLSYDHGNIYIALSGVSEKYYYHPITYISLVSLIALRSPVGLTTILALLNAFIIFNLLW